MASIKVHITNADAVKGKLRRMSELYGDAVTLGINECCIDIQRDAVYNIESYGTRTVKGVVRQWLVDTGRMRASISLTFANGADLQDGDASEGSHLATRSQLVSQASAMRRATGVATRVHYASYHELGRGGQRRRPFLKPAAEQNKQNLPRLVEKYIKKVKP